TVWSLFLRSSRPRLDPLSFPTRRSSDLRAFLHAFAGGAHGFPGDAVRLVDVLGSAFPALLMDQVEIAQGRLPVRHPLEQNTLGRSEEYTSELQSQSNLVCRLLLEKKKIT